MRVQEVEESAAEAAESVEKTHGSKGIKRVGGFRGCVEGRATVGMSKSLAIELADREKVKWMKAKLCCVVQPLRGGSGSWPPQNFPSDGVMCFNQQGR